MPIFANEAIAKILKRILNLLIQFSYQNKLFNHRSCISVAEGCILRTSNTLNIWNYCIAIFGVISGIFLLLSCFGSDYWIRSSIVFPATDWHINTNMIMHIIIMMLNDCNNDSNAEFGLVQNKWLIFVMIYLFDVIGMY